MKKLLIIDSHGLIHRAFHALPPLTTPDGKPIGAVYGLASMLLKILSEHKPDYAAAAFDRPEPTFRKERLAAYKAQRPPADPNLIAQFESARQLFSAFGIPIIDRAGFEADDIIASLVEKFSKETGVVIVSGDLDTLQLVRDGAVEVRAPRKSLSDIITYNEAAVEEKLGIPPRLVTDYKGLVGDVSDNIPGVRGIGPKSAVELLKTYGSLEQAIEKADTEKGAGKKLAAERETAILSKELATMDRTVPIEGDLEAFVYAGMNTEALEKIFNEFGFMSLIGRINKQNPPKAESPAAQPKEKIAGKIEWSWKEIIRRALPKEPPEDIEDLSVMAWLVDPDENQNLSFDEACAKFKVSAGDREALFSKLKEKISAEGLERVYREIELPVIPVLARMEHAGLQVNAKKLAKLEAAIAEKIKETESEVAEIAGVSINLNSPQQVAELLFGKLGLAPHGKKTATGRVRTDRDALSELSGAHPIISKIIEYREDAKVRSGFVAPLKEIAERDGEIHTTFLETGTATGRLASEQPNLQNIPQESPWSAPLRDAFEARKGKTLLSLDYSQLELRILAHVSRDEGLISAFTAGRDIHTETAVRIFKVSAHEVSKSMRRTAKVLNFGVVYGMGSRSFAKASGLPLKEAEELVAGYFTNFPRIKAWQTEVINGARGNGFVENENGRKRWFKESRFPGEFDRAAINMPIQSLAADIMKIAMVNAEISSRKLGGTLALSIHDELLFEVPDDMLREIAADAKKIMESSTKISVPLEVDVKHGKTWGAMEKL